MTKGLGLLSWQDLVSTLRDEAMVIGLDYAILHVNPAVLARLELPSSQVLGLPCYRVFHQAESPCHERGEPCPMRLVLETGRPASVVRRQTSPKGYHYYIEIDALPLMDATGTVVSVLYLVRELGRAERHQRIVDTMEIGIAVVSHSGRLVEVNPALCRMLGYTKEEMADRNVTEFITADLALSLRETPESGAPPPETYVPRKDGSVFPAELTVSGLPLGQVTLYVAFVRDVSRRSERKEIIARQAQALAQSQSEYKELFHNSADALVVIEDDTTIVMANRQFERLAGYPGGEADGKLSFLEIIPAELREQALESHRRRRQTEGGILPLYRIWGTTKDGARRLMEVSGALIPGTKRTLVSVRDITEAHRQQGDLLQRNRELEALQAVTAILSRSTDLDKTLGQVLEEVLKLTGLDRGLIYLLDEEKRKLFIRAHKGPSDRTLKAVDGLELGEGFGGRVAETGKPIFVPDISVDPRLTRTLAAQGGYKALASVPLVSSGKLLGVLTVSGHGVREFSREERRLLGSMGNEISVALERAQLLRRAQDRARELESLMSVTREMVSSLELQEVLDRSLAIMCRQVGATQGFICMLDEERGELVAKTFSGDRVAPVGRTWKMGDGVVGWVAQHQQPILCDDIGGDPRIRGSQSPAGGSHSTVAAPLKVKEKLLGVVVLAAREKAAFSEAHLRLLSAYAAEASMALENALLHQAVKKQASTDELTQLANRRYFYLRLEEETRRAERYNRPLSLLFLDVDELKLINDRYGHLQGDQLLRHLASLLAKVIRTTDVAARLGGDEFVILLPETSREEAASVAERLLAEATPCPLESGVTIPWRMSIGVAWAPVKGSYDVDLLRLADDAVYRAKHEGTGWSLARVAGTQTPLPLDEKPLNGGQKA